MQLISLTDVSRKLAFASFGDRFRVAGLADIDRPGFGFDPETIQDLAAKCGFGAAEHL
ncbi:MAG TPA: hypothetical protein GXX48_11875 [Ochrobactrum intermedium]|uniref:Uncharacterized protein n=1 Tax=Brucella intermedia TaxID=94625 RepID=A0A7V6PC82_9HYPH|nr:hypothetical protein [Brucella intermedia]